MFGYSSSVKDKNVCPCTPELLFGAMQSAEVSALCAAIKKARDALQQGKLTAEQYDRRKAMLKRRLPVITPHATFLHGRRCNSEAIPSGLVMYDIDHLPEPRSYYASHIAGHEKRLGIVLAHVTPSLEGLRLVFVPPAKMSPEEAQREMARQLGAEVYDRSVKDMARCSFLVPEDYVLHIDGAGLFADHTPPEAKAAARAVPAQPAPPASPAATPPPQADAPPPASVFGGRDAAATGRPAEAREDGNKPLPAFQGIPYAVIIREWFKLTGGEPQPGERNSRLHRLASHLRYITDGDQQLLLEIIPDYGLAEEEMRTLIRSACSAKFCGLPSLMRRAVRMATEACSAPPKTAGDPLETPQGDLPPPIPEKLPPLIKLLLSRTPEVYQAAVAHAVFPPLATHLHRVRFRYINNVLHETTLMNVLMAGTGAGKECISEPINRIMADIRQRDAAHLAIEKEWKQAVSLQSTSKDRPSRPKGLVIQEIDADMTNPAFVMRTVEAEDHFLYTRLNEIEQFDALKGHRNTGNHHFQIICLAFDPGNRYGQTRAGPQSITEKIQIRFNWNATTTITKGIRYFSRVLTDGPVSRINFCTIPEREIGADMPVYGTYGEDFDQKLKPFIDNLCRASGDICLPQAARLARRLREETAERARLSQNRAYENLSFRALVIAWLKACVLYVAQGCRWDKRIEEFARWSLHYDLWCKMHFFGEAMTQAMAEHKAASAPSVQPRNLLDMLPAVFSLTDAVNLRRRFDLPEKGTAGMLRQWKFRGYIRDDEEGYYLNVKKTAQEEGQPEGEEEMKQMPTKEPRE